MSETIFTFPGKCGDAIHQFPIAAHWARQHTKRFICWLDEKTCRPIAPLFRAQPCVEAVEFRGGVESYQCGGQPFHFDLATSEYEGRNIYHLGLRGFPSRQLTLECLATSNVPVGVGADELTRDAAYVVPDPHPATSRLILHGQGVAPHSRTTPAFWRFLHRVWPELAERFDQIVFVGSDDDRAVAREAYPDADEFNDRGDFLELARLLATSTAMIGCGSSPVALAQWLKIPTLRVHDPIGEAPRRIWDGLGDNQFNLPEVDLRTEWPGIRDRWFSPKILAA